MFTGDVKQIIAFMTLPSPKKKKKEGKKETVTWIYYTSN
jgi:hypothetical protein